MCWTVSVAARVGLVERGLDVRVLVATRAGPRRGLGRRRLAELARLSPVADPPVFPVCFAGRP
jgi:hypothetical protein